ncbi:MAG: hypothetical protein ACYC96_16915, partial [Fimbriimonadaceae bacterium]
DGGLDPAVGVNLDYFVDDEGFAKPTCRMPGEGPTWIDGLVVLKGNDGSQRMFAAYAKVKGGLEVHARGLAEFNDERHEFEQVAEYDMRSPVYPSGHPIIHTVEGVEYIYFADPAPLLRVRAKVESLADLAQYEAYTCLVPGSRLDNDAASARLDRAGDGAPRWAWKRDTPVVTPQLQRELLKRGQLKPGEAVVDLEDPDTGQRAVAHRGSVYFNEFRRRWIMIATEVGGTSPLGEVWYAEAAAPEGPWRHARKVLSHDRYSFYNPKQHPYFDQQGGRVIYFEGTLTHTFSGNPTQTPRYDYNQMMYQLDLADERLKLPD